MALEKIKMGRVGGLRPPDNIARALRDFDPDLFLRWSFDDQCWTVVQKTRRKRFVGKLRGSDLFEIRDVEVPVLYLNDWYDLDHRIINELQKRRFRSKKERQEYQLRQLSEAKKASRKAAEQKFEPARERLYNACSELRSKGFAGSGPRVAPIGGWNVGDSEAA